MIKSKINRLAIVGAGGAAKNLIGSITPSSSLSNKYKIIGLFDDDDNKINTSIEGYKVLDKISNISKHADFFDSIVIAVPSCSEKQFKDIYNSCLKAKKYIMTVPAYGEILNSPKNISSVRDIDIEDLINRKEMPINRKIIEEIIKNEIVLVTGGAGSIGSEIIKQCLKGSARKIICIDSSEYNTYNLQKEISTKKLVCITADIKDKNLMELYFNKFKPTIVFHAAALKHVNLQENDIRNTLLTNFYGTENILDCSENIGVKNFVLISTDKAVEPSNNMGLSKRLAELLLSERFDDTKINLSIVRFGNVVGSSGSVLNLFSDLIREKKDLLITHPKVKRFFMSIEEACYLVIQSIKINSSKSNICMIDMGNEIFIKDIAETLIQLNNLVPNKDINIKYSKLRKGEKLSEKLEYSFEKRINTDVDKLVFLESLNTFKECELENFKIELLKMIYNKNIKSAEIESFINKSLIKHLS
jgi:FlaA1/EpsC-like NDP-sugar epimerase